ncbi:unnamed protein product [Cladocopium goreaui]|uniref:Nipped-B-like protein B n=1 Tax=Cladocopium goreaui TaxID=2562237 RepID=A0A9P1D1X3_9DINO|nr:unnamed protein product [Cladocopium goreaui]|mmetsp:Transcript_63807/g.139847  ORF Transcript_63807/g.139847 Transcript_63807/m.139847 type:complete len:132 (+) Transcript_63807:143-538(+)
MPRLCFKRLDSSAGSVSSNGLASRKRQKIETLPESKTVTTFASMIGRGRCSIDAAAELARDIVHDHDVAPHPAIKSFASLGNEGQSRSNQERDLHRWMKNRCAVGAFHCRVIQFHWIFRWMANAKRLVLFP